MQHFSFLLHSRRLCTGLPRENPCDRETAAVCAGIFAMKYDENSGRKAAQDVKRTIKSIHCWRQTNTR